MKSRKIAAMVALAATQVQTGEAAAQRANTTRLGYYANARFGYSILYPSDFLVPEPESGNSDGRSFHSPRRLGKLSVWGSYASELETTPVSIARLYETDCRSGSITYEVLKLHLIAFSCVNRTGMILYQKTIIGRDDVLRSVRFEYPYSDRATWNPVVRQVANSLHALNVQTYDD